MRIKFLTFLGTGNYTAVKFGYKNQLIDYTDDNTQNFVQISVFNIISKLISTDAQYKDIIDKNISTYAFVTKDAKVKNYLGEGEGRNAIDYEPLCKHRDSMNITPVDIFDGMTDEEVWKNFNIILSVIDEGDIIFADVTNSARSIPLMFMSLLNFAKTSKNIKIGGIFYGAYDFGNSRKEGKITNILNLEGFDTVTNWSNSVDMLLTKGGSKRFCSEMKNLVSEIKRNNYNDNKVDGYVKNVTNAQKHLNEFLNALNFCDVKLACKHIKILKEIMLYIENNYDYLNYSSIEKIKPLMTLFNKINELIKDFKILDCIDIQGELSKKDGALSKSDQFKVIYNVMIMTDMCINFELYQQALTLLNENITSIIVFESGLNMFSLPDREYADWYLLYVNILNGKDQTKLEEEKIRRVNEYFSMLNKNTHDELAEISRLIGDYRNTVNHANFRIGNNSISSKCSKIKKYAYIVKDYILNMEQEN